MREVVHDEHLERDHWWFRARREIFRRFLAARVALPPEPRVLDLGPGSGVNLEVLAPVGNLVNVDLSRLSLERLRDQSEGSAFDSVQADAMRLPFADASFDLVCALDVLEHLQDDRAALTEIERVLRPGGSLLFSVPAHRWLWGRQDVLAEHERRYARAELRHRLDRAGFSIDRMSYLNCLLFPPIAAVRIAMRPFLSRSVKGGSDLALRLPFGLDEALFRIFAVEGRWLPKRDLPMGVSLFGLARARAKG